MLGILGNNLAKSLTQVPDNPGALSSTLNSALLITRLRCYLDATANKIDTWQSVVSAMQISTAIFATADPSDGQAECRIGDEVVTLPGTGPQHYTDAGNWLTALWLSIICRESERLDMLSNTPIDLLRGSGAQFDEYIYSWVEALQTYWAEGEGLGRKIRNAIEGTDPEGTHIASRELLLKTLFPPIDLFYHFALGQPDEFNSALVEALELHRDYWAADDERRRDPDGFVALGPLAITCLAHDAGIPIEVESEYMPRHLIQRSWLGEFPT